MNTELEWKQLFEGTSIIAFQFFYPIVCFIEFCNGDRVLKCTATASGPDCIDWTDIQLRDKYIHLCFLSVVVKATIHQYTQFVHHSFPFCVCNFSYNFLTHMMYCWSFLLFLSLLIDTAYIKWNPIKSVEKWQNWLSFSIFF